MRKYANHEDRPSIGFNFLWHTGESTFRSTVLLGIICTVCCRNRSTLAGNMRCIRFLSRSVCRFRIRTRGWPCCTSFRSRISRILLILCCSKSLLGMRHTYRPRKLELSLDNRYSFEVKYRKFDFWDSSCTPESLNRSILDGSSLGKCNRSRMSRLHICMILSPYQSTILAGTQHISESICCNTDFMGILYISIRWKLAYRLGNQHIFAALCRRSCCWDMKYTFWSNCQNNWDARMLCKSIRSRTDRLDIRIFSLLYCKFFPKYSFRKLSLSCCRTVRFRRTRIFLHWRTVLLKDSRRIFSDSHHTLDC
jgi:hypothetical protein